MLFPPALLPSGPPHSRPPAPQPHLGPEFPVSLDSAWPPRPRSSSPASTTTERPMMSHTFGGGVVRGGGGGDQALSHHPDPPAPPLPSSPPPSAVCPPYGTLLGPQRRPTRCPDPRRAVGQQWGQSGLRAAPPAAPGTPQAHPVLVLRPPVALPVRVVVVPAAAGRRWGVRRGRPPIPSIPLVCPWPHWGAPVLCGAVPIPCRAVPIPHWGVPVPTGVSLFPTGVSLFPTGVSLSITAISPSHHAVPFPR